MSAVLQAVVAPSTAERPYWIGAAEWERMPWPARMRAARRALRSVPPVTDDGADEPGGGPSNSPQSAAASVPSSPDPDLMYPCAIGCGRHTTLVYCDPCAALHATAPATPPPAWLLAAWANRDQLTRLAAANHRHVLHPRNGGYRNSPRPFRPVTP